MNWMDWETPGPGMSWVFVVAIAVFLLWHARNSGSTALEGLRTGSIPKAYRTYDRHKRNLRRSTSPVGFWIHVVLYVCLFIGFVGFAVFFLYLLATKWDGYDYWPFRDIWPG